jgi:hypothetical protein
VVSSHGVDARKADRLREMRLPWVEVRATSLVAEVGVPWTSAQPLEVVADAALYPEHWRCPVCAPRHAAREAMERNGVRAIAWRPLHLYLSDAGRSSGEVRVRAVTAIAMERREDGVPVEVWVERSGTRSRLAGPTPVRDAAEALTAAHQLFRGWVRRMRRERAAAVDSPTHWSGVPARASFPQRLRWDPLAEAFRGVPNLPALWSPATGGQPDAVLGYSPCAWSERHPRRGVVTHAVDGAWWLTLAVHRWEENGEPATRADLAAFHHDGARWRETGRASRVAGALDWAGLLPRLAERVREGNAGDADALTLCVEELAGEGSAFSG